ncbi:patatin-like phospholipase family protein [Pedococcus sp. 5OH_020]|uniref:patatin-like phospholipase family protein n=1 Tax=Pedococcus sp. 5OH_020 TaxID=2989814 RepID=UPI0022E9D15B|nr:patatin-like phospholipase family protein [Pedococcus sp. 5OH_020]
MTTAFVLTGGGSLGAVQVGMMAALQEQGVTPDVLVGTSVGAVNAAYLAGPGTSDGRLESLSRLWNRMRRRDVFAPHPQRWVGAVLGAAPSLFTEDPLRRLLQDNLGYAELEHARLEVHVTAADLVTGEAAILSAGPVVTAVLASAAVPGLLPAVTRDGRTLVDGAVGDVDALRHADACGVDEMYLLPAGYPCAGPAPVSAAGTALTSLSLVLHHQLLHQVREYRGRAALHVVPPLCPLVVSPADFSHAASLQNRARHATRGWLTQSASHAAEPDATALALHHHAGWDRPPQTAWAQSPQTEGPQSPHTGDPGAHLSTLKGLTA